MTDETVELRITNLHREDAALYHVYPNQNSPQPAFVQMDADGTVTANWNGEIGNAVSMDVWNRRAIRWPVSPMIAGGVLAEFLESEAAGELLAAVYEGHSVEWNGHNHVGKLTPEAREASEAFGQLLDRLADDPANFADISADEDE